MRSRSGDWPSVDDERVAGIIAIADGALSSLDLDEVLDALLTRTLALLQADTAAVLLVDASGQELFARMSRGIEEEVRQGVRVPIGRGFAGRVAAERAPVLLDEVNSTTVANPILWQKGIQKMLGAPLLADGSLVGVLHVGRLRREAFNDQDIELIEFIADRAATAIKAQLVDASRAAGEVLQRSLLPSAPPKLGELEFAARYVPTEHGGVGGDWYDVFQLDNGTIWIVTGDVIGHGLQAAAVMGRVRSALRAYALLDAAPDVVLAHTDRKIRQFEVGEMATVAIAMVPPPYDTAHVALAGHPPVVAATPSTVATFVDAPAGPPLGVGLDLPWPVTTVPIAPGDVLFFYTDGLIERRHESLDIGLERLRSAVRADPPELICQQVMAALIGDYEPDDDIAVLALRRQPT